MHEKRTVAGSVGGLALVLAGLTLLATAGGWAYYGPELEICQNAVGACGSGPVPYLYDQLPMLRPEAFAALALASLCPLVALIDRRLSLRLFGGAVVVGVALATLIHAAYPPPHLLDKATATSLPYTSPTLIGVVGLLAVALGSAVELLFLFPLLRSGRRHRYSSRPARGFQVSRGDPASKPFLRSSPPGGR